MTVDEQRALHRRAVGDLVAVGSRVREDDLRRPTPCAGWDLADLLAHVVGQQLGFAAAALDGDAPAQAYAPVPYDHVGLTGSAAAMVEAFAGLSDGTQVREVELAPTPLPARVVVGAQLLDSAVHAWDVARALDLAYRPDEEVVAAVLAIARSVPDGEGRERPGSAFARALPASGDDPWSHVLTLLGRDPGWAPTVSG